MNALGAIAKGWTMRLRIVMVGGVKLQQSKENEMKRLLLVVLLISNIPNPSCVMQAQTRTNIAMATAAIFDAETTIHTLRVAHAVEANPVAAPFMSRRVTAYAFTIGTTIPLMLLPKGAPGWLKYAAIGGHFAAGVHNIQVGWRWKR